jgi:hypothetical protein
MDNSPELLFLTGRDSIKLDSTVNYNDSIKLFFDKLIQNDPENPTPYILKFKYQFRSISLSDTSILSPLKTALDLDSSNIRANYMLGKKYYFLFNRQIKSNPDNPKNKLFAKNALIYLDKSYHLDSTKRNNLKYPLIQLANYLGDTSRLSNYERNESLNNYYFPLLKFSELSKNWKTDYKLNVLLEVNAAKFSLKWYSKHLEAMNEPIIYSNSCFERVYRFLWLRSFDDPITVRIQKTDGKVKLFWKRTGGSGGYDPGSLIVDKQKKLSIEKWNDFISMIEAIDYWSKPTVNNEMLGKDGARWILEASDNGKYHIVDRWSMQAPKFRETCLYLINLTDLKIDEEDIY